VAQQDVEQLWDFVNGSFAHKLADWSQPLFIRQQVPVCVAVIRHRLELDNREHFPIPARPLLGKPYFSLVRNSKQQDNDDYYRRSYN
jgi:hypothetical protein